MTSFWRYLGGEWIPGVPARDLSTDEYDTLFGDIIAANHRATGRTLYELVKPVASKPRAKPAPELEDDKGQED